MGKVKLLAEFRTMEGFIIDRVEFGVDSVDWRGRVSVFAKDAPAIDVMENGIELM